MLVEKLSISQEIFCESQSDRVNPPLLSPKSQRGIEVELQFLI
jgi:hypothetical protein